MLGTYKQLVTNQFEAVFCTMAALVEKCPDANWRAPVASLTFNQAVFHALFYTDVYLGPDLKSLKEQSFHQEHAKVFADYEELEDRVQQAVYEKAFIKDYIAHCREKVGRVIAAETEESLEKRPGFDWQSFSRAELHVYNIRHLHHHAAQLSLRLRIDAGVEIPWVRSGWKD